MFRIDQQPTFSREVQIPVPVGDGVDEQSLIVTYNVLTIEEFRQHDLATREGTDGFLDAAIGTIGGLVNHKGEEVSFDDYTKSRLFGLPYVRKALVKGYVSNVAGEIEGN